MESLTLLIKVVTIIMVRHRLAAITIIHSSRQVLCAVHAVAEPIHLFALIQTLEDLMKTMMNANHTGRILANVEITTTMTLTQMRCAAHAEEVFLLSVWTIMLAL